MTRARDVVTEAVEVIIFLWKWKHSDERSLEAEEYDFWGARRKQKNLTASTCRNESLEAEALWWKKLELEAYLKEYNILRSRKQR